MEKCKGWKHTEHEAEATQVVYIPDRYASTYGVPLPIPVKLCRECAARYQAQPGDYQSGREVSGE